MRATGLTIAISGIVAVTIAACSSVGSTGRTGDLGHGVFYYQCQTDQDPICPEGSTTMQGCARTSANPTGVQCFPSSVAVGGRFRIQYAPNGSAEQVGNPVLRTVSGDYMSALGDGSFKALKTGYVGIYSQSTVDSTLVDYTLVKINPISALRISDTTTKKAVPTNILLTRGASAAYKIAAFDSNSQPLAGAIESFVWETSDARTVALQDEPHTATMHVSAVAAGSATLTAYADDSKTVKATFTITVQ